MTPPFSGAWSAHQLADFLSTVSVCQEEQHALTLAVEHAAEAFDAPMAAIVQNDRVRATVGLANPEAHEQEILDAADGTRAIIHVPGPGACQVAVAISDRGGSGRLIVARQVHDPFSAEERGLLTSMMRVLSLSVHNLGLMNRLRERQDLLERLSTIQRSISHRAELHDVLDAITSGLAELFGADVAMVRLTDPENPDQHLLVSSYGLPQGIADAIRRLPAGHGIAGEAMTTGQLVTSEDVTARRDMPPPLIDYGMKRMMGTPVHEGGTIVGAIAMGSRDLTGPYSLEEQETLQAFAEHASLALTDAHALAGLRRSLYDPLTGLPNRSFFDERLHQATSAPTEDSLTAVLFVDLDRFKAINDSLGHTAGDQLLITVAERLAESVRPGDFVARMGGDEFTILLENLTSVEEAQTIAERVAREVRLPVTIAGRELSISASIGVAAHAAPHTLETGLVHAADLAMYHAKAIDRGRVQLFLPELGRRARRRLDVEHSLRAALARDELTLAYQPLVSFDAPDHIVAVEGLLRWERAMDTGISIPEVIAVAEDSGLIHELGVWVISQTTRQLADWQSRFGSLSPTAHVNISGHQLRDSSTVEFIAQTMRSGTLDPASLTLEITESILIGGDDSAVLVNLAGLRDIGIQIALDDFGKGYSSLAYLTELDIQTLKIDRAFVRRLGEGGADTVVEHLIAMAQQLGMMVVAEGVETSDQLIRLRSLGCDLAQGFLIARPMTAAAIEQVLQTGGRLPGNRPLTAEPAERS